MLKWVTAGILSLQAAVSQAADLPNPVTHSDFPSDPMSTVLLGRDLFFDPILSGNRNIACATCHHNTLISGDVDRDLGSTRRGQADNVAKALKHRNVPALFNLGATEFVTLSHDGRVSRDPSARMGFAMPDGATLERPVPNALAAQAMMALTNPDEMAGSLGENVIAELVARGKIRGLNGAWQKITERVEAIPTYRRRFDMLTGPHEPLHVTDIAKALAAYTAYEFRATDSPFDAYLSDRPHALTPPQKRGLDLFYGKAGCSTCHAGPFQTDHDFHAIGTPQVGSGKGHGEPLSDHGRAAVTGETVDLYRFRTPSLRNVALTAPYGHSGAYATLEAVVRHHLGPGRTLLAYDLSAMTLPGLNSTAPPTAPIPGADEITRIAEAVEHAPVALSDADVDDLLAFLHALTDPYAAIGRLGAPAQVPSGLPTSRLVLH
ncbi:cytochrome-c peroxidase [Marimonas arenosa]|uniref:Cytochrome-c peroxidase n=1 Tax=Marimonas arenosa TaxID=1795305 RepID=A0AAE4B309_9RHOB|nr:cytochrome c peroxidase [Marimonas arenosa]MDQ2088807.1 cytochrome-c peroxidase [Marimonas arenosa]